MWQIAAYSCADDVFPLVVAELPQPLIKTACFIVRSVAQFVGRRKRPANRDRGATSTAREGPPVTPDPALDPDPVLGPLAALVPDVALDPENAVLDP
jgi:hypothetical protein